MRSDRLWRLLFSGSVVVLLLGILLLRTEPAPIWFLVVYPAIGGVLAHMASRTSPTVEGIARVETSVIAATALFVLWAIVNVLLVDFLIGQMLADVYVSGLPVHKVAFIALPAIAVCLWWALERRLARVRMRGVRGRAGDAPAGKTRPVQRV